MSSRDICDILEASAKFNVRVLKFGDLYVSFDRNIEKQKQVNSSVTQSPSETKNSDKEISEEQHKELTKETLEFEELKTREELIAELHITDPLRAEEMLRNEELEDYDSDESDTIEQ